MSGLPREVLKWVQSLDLTMQIKNPKWDLSNGFLIAEIFSWYFPQDIQMFSFYKADSLENKKKNWFILKNFILKNQIAVSIEDVNGTIFCKEGAAVKLLESLYECLTSRSVKKISPEGQVDYTDYAYQMRLPMHQRSTLSKALKNNLRLPEILADLNITKDALMPSWYSDRTIIKSQKIVNDHIEHRRDERRANPARFGIKPTLGDLCVRHSTSRRKLSIEPIHLSSTTDNMSELHSPSGGIKRAYETECKEEVHFFGSAFAGDTFSEQYWTREPSVHFKEVDVKQTNKSASYQLPLQAIK